MRRWPSALLALALLGTWSHAQTSAPASEPTSGPTAPVTLRSSSDVEEIIDALDARGHGLKDFTADVRLTETDNVTQDASSRAGRVYFQAMANCSTRMRVAFATREVAGKSRPARKDYLLDAGILTERDYDRKIEIRRQVLKPGEKINLLKLGEGPFPLPIGQDKASVHKMFEVRKIVSKDSDPPATVHAQLAPKPDTQFYKRFSTIDVWVDLRSNFPRRIETLDRNESSVRGTDLTNIQINPSPSLGDKDFTLDKINETDGWTIHDEAYSE